MTDDVKNNFLDRTVGTDLIAKTKDVNNPEALYEELIGIVKKYHPSDNTEIIERAYKLASEAHGNQVRKSGAPYITHPLHVAIILADLKADKETIVAGLLHDFFYGDLRYINVIERKYMLNAHPYFAYYNASKIFKLNEKEKNMILSHMFPISYEVPRYKESILLDLVDDLEALKEVGIYIKDRLKHNINLILIMLNEVV